MANVVINKASYHIDIADLLCVKCNKSVTIYGAFGKNNNQIGNSIAVVNLESLTIINLLVINGCRLKKDSILKKNRI